MPSQILPLSRVLAGIACGWLAVSARAELIKVSPFLPPQNAQTAPTQNAPLEYRGSMELSGVEQYRIVDPQKKVGIWLKVGEKDENLGIVLKQHDKDRDTVVVDQGGQGGQSLTLPLRVPKVVSSGAPQALPQMVAPNPAPNVPPAVTQAVVPNPTPADEARRLEAVAAEVARRRALREQAAQQAQGAPASVPPPNVTRQDLQNAQSQIRR